MGEVAFRANQKHSTAFIYKLNDNRLAIQNRDHHPEYNQNKNDDIQFHKNHLNLVLEK